MKNPFSIIKRAWDTHQVHKKMPLRIEFNITEACNLNCRGCTHYSPLAPREFEPLDRLERNMRHLSATSADGIDKVYLIGGETLLYPQLIEAGRLARECFPNAEISIFTNGLLIPKMSDEFWEMCRECNIIMAITRYPIKFDYDNGEAICREKGIKTDVFADRSLEKQFCHFRLDPTKGANKYLAHFKCFNYGCLTIQGDKLFPCSLSSCVGHLNKAFDLHFRHEEGDYVKVEDIKSARDIRRFRAKAVPFCSYCRDFTYVPYGPSRRDKSEWLAD